MKRTKPIATPSALSPLAQYNQQRAEQAQTAYGGKSVVPLSSRAQHNNHRESK